MPHASHACILCSETTHASKTVCGTAREMDSKFIGLRGRCAAFDTGTAARLCARRVAVGD